MQTARNYLADATYRVEQALNRMPAAASLIAPLPVNPPEIARYVEQLLTDEEQQICDMATD